jgi:hypothetical protein
MVIIFISVGILIDLFSCYLFLRKNRKRYGPSGILMATPIVFYFFPILISNYAVISAFVWLDCIYFACFHIFIVLVIPFIDRKLLQFRDANLMRKQKITKKEKK